MRPSLLFLLVMMILPPSAGAQSLFGSQGLGMLLEPLDARARGLGSVGVGLLGPSLHPADLAAAARIYLPSGQLTLQPQWVDVDLAGETLSTRATRFTQMGLAYPVPSLSGTAVLQIGSFLDQRWVVEESSTQEFRGEEVAVNDVFRSDGGVSTVELGWAQRMGETLSLGVGLGSRIGSVSRSFQRIIEAEEAGDVVPFRTGGEWRYSGLLASLGFQWDAGRSLRLGGSVTWSQDLEAKPTESTDGEAASFDLPTEFRLGATGVLTPRLAASAGFSYANWTSSGDALGAEAVTGAVLSYGGGLEWAGPVWGIRNFPIRLGFRRSDLPFTFEGEDPTETAFTGGIGLNLVPAQTGLVGAIDLGVERGKREAGSLSESFWKASITFRVGSF